MISVEQALEQVLALCEPLGSESITLQQAAGRVLSTTSTANRNQPPFATSVMDGYALRTADVTPGATLTVIGEAAAGGRFTGNIAPGQAVRIFTGAPVPNGADRVLIQEDCTREGDQITVHDGADQTAYIRPIGADFRIGDPVTAPRRLRAQDIALLAAMNIPQVTVTRRPRVALIATGDELVMPGEDPGPNQIVSSNNLGLAARLSVEGALPRVLPIARDTTQSLIATLDLARDADLIVTLGGASVGDHDLVRQVATEKGLKQSFYKVAMRPGKPLMAGHLGNIPMIGLPGNPVSAMVCGEIFLIPALRALLGLGKSPRNREPAILGRDMAPNGPREHYMRAGLNQSPDDLICTPFDRQDSALLTVLAGADALMVRAPSDPARSAGDRVEIIRL